MKYSFLRAEIWLRMLKIADLTTKNSKILKKNLNTIF